MSETSTRQFITRTGLKLVADCYGDSAAQPVLLAHGGGQTRHSWGQTARALAQAGYYAVVYDQRGHGDSEWAPDADYHFFSFADDIADIVAKLGRAPIAVGASLGGIASLTAQHRYPGLLKALVLVDITPHIQASGLERIRSFMQEKMETGFASLEEAAAYVQAYTPERTRAIDPEGLKKNLRLKDDGRWRWHWDPKFLDQRGVDKPVINVGFMEEAVRGLTLPTLLVRGKMSDLITEESAQQFLTMCPHAQYADIKDAGHMVAGDQNDVFSQAVIGFVESLK